VNINGSPLSIAAGSNHSLALKPDGTVVGWGNNDYGQRDAPAGLKNVAAIAAGAWHNLALRADGTVVGWGRNDSGQTNIPAGLNVVVAIAAGGSNSLALQADGTVVGWGANGHGQTNIPAGLTNAVAIAAGGSHNLALTADGTVVGWGNTNYGQAKSPAGLSDVVAIAAGFQHSLALNADGKVVGWGRNDYRQTNTPANLSNVVAIAAGCYHSLALRANGTVVAWGRNDYSQTNTPAGLSNVVAIAAGYYHSLALKSDGTVIAWGRNDSAQTNSPAGLTTLDLAVVRAGTVDVNVPGPYELSYTATNRFGAVGITTRAVEVIPATPLVTTQRAKDVGSTGATLRGEVNPRGAETLAWFEYGLTTKYGATTGALNLGRYPYHLNIISPVTGLLPWMTYHFRAVGSNSVGRIDGPDLTVTLSGPFGPGTEPRLSDIAGMTIWQGGRTNVAFTASPAGLDVRVRCDNPVLLPETGIGLTTLNGNLWLNLVPDPRHSGTAQVTVTASDGTRAAQRTFTLSVLALSTSPLLLLSGTHPVSAEAWQFRVLDYGTAATNYSVEYRSDLASTNLWTAATNVTAVGSGWYQVTVNPAPRSAAFYRVKGLCWLTASLASPESIIDEGAASGAVVVFNGFYHGSLNYTWGGTEGTNTGTVQVNGSTAVIPIPPLWVRDNATLDPVKYLTLRLEGGPGYSAAGTTEGSITVQENDAAWQGTLIIPNGLAATAMLWVTNRSDGGHSEVTLPQNGALALGFTLTMLETNGCFWGQIQSDGYGFFPTNALVQLSLSQNRFNAVATHVPLPALAGSPLFNQPTHIDVRLDAANQPGQTNVGPAQIQGVATLVGVVPGRPYLDSAASGTFLLLKPSEPVSTNRVPLYPVR
jgi:hypothetical protein